MIDLDGLWIRAVLYFRRDGDRSMRDFADRCSTLPTRTELHSMLSLLHSRNAKLGSPKGVALIKEIEEALDQE